MAQSGYQSAEEYHDGSRITQHDLNWIAARLLPDIYDINQRDKYDRVTRRLESLYQELSQCRIDEMNRLQEKRLEKYHRLWPKNFPMQNPFNEPKSMSVTGIQSGAFEAKLAEMRKKLADRMTQGLHKMDVAAESGAAKMDAAVDGVVAKVDKEIEDKLHEFASLTNGGPA
jgi:hypothetical protein